MEFIIRLQGEERRRERESGEICLKNETAKEKIYEEEERNKDEKRIWIEYEFKHYRTISDKLRGRKKKKKYRFDMRQWEKIENISKIFF